MLGRLGFTGRVMAILLLALLAFVAASATLGFALNSDRSQVGGCRSCRSAPSPSWICWIAPTHPNAR